MENKDLKETLRSELKTMYQMIGIMEPKNEAEFIAVALPNLHTALFEWLQSKQEEIEKAIEKMPNATRTEVDIEKVICADDLKPIISNLLK